MGSSQDAWQEMERGTCEVCNKVKRVCREDGCNGTIAKSSTVDDKCRGFVNTQFYDYPVMLRFNHSLSDDEIKQIEEAINSMFRIF